MPWASVLGGCVCVCGHSRKGVAAVDIRRPTLAPGVCLSTQRMEREEYTVCVCAVAPQGVFLNMGKGQLLYRSAYLTAQLHSSGPVPALHENQTHNTEPLLHQHLKLLLVPNGKALLRFMFVGH